MINIQKRILSLSKRLNAIFYIDILALLVYYSNWNIPIELKINNKVVAKSDLRLFNNSYKK